MTYTIFLKSTDNIQVEQYIKRSNESKKKKKQNIIR